MRLLNKIDWKGRFLMALAFLMHAATAEGQVRLLSYETPSYVQFGKEEFVCEESSGAQQAEIVVVRGGDYRRPAAVLLRAWTKSNAGVEVEEYSYETRVEFQPGESFLTTGFEVPENRRSEEVVVHLRLEAASANTVVTGEDARLIVRGEGREARLRIEAGEGGSLRLSWPAGCGECVVERSSDPVRGEWAGLEGTGKKGTDGRMEVVVENGGAHWFYRLRFSATAEQDL